MILHDIFTIIDKSNLSPWTVVTWIFTVITELIFAYITAVWKYMGSSDRQSKLYKKYYKEQTDNLRSH